MIRVYIAAPYPALSEAQRVRQWLADAGITCTSRWIVEDSAELNEEWARKDLADVARADMLVALNPPEWSDAGTGGRHVEFGFAVALHKPILLVGHRTNIFHYLSTVVLVSRAEDLPHWINVVGVRHGLAA